MTTMEETYQATSHFYNERRARFFNLSFGTIGILLLSYFQVLHLSTGLSLGLCHIIHLLANYFSTPKLDLFKHSVCIMFGIAAYPILTYSPSDVMLARLVSLFGAISIGFEQRTYAPRAFYSLISALPWIVITKTKYNFEFNECYNKILDQETPIFICCFLVLMLIAASHSDLEMKALKTTETALSDLKVINAKYEQANRELSELLQEKDNFILLFSHETRNPLNILMGNLSVLLTEVQTPRLKARVIRAKFCAELLLHNLNNILDTGKLLNKGNLEVAPVIVNLSQYLHSIWDIIKMMAMKKQLQSMLVIPQPLPGFVKLDAQRISQVIINLVSNSVKFTAAGSVGLNVSYLKKREIKEEDFLPSSVFGNKLKIDIRAEKKSLFSAHEQQHDENVNKKVDSMNFAVDDEFPAAQLINQECYIQELLRELNPNTQIPTERWRHSEAPTDRSKHSDGEGYLKIEVIDTGCGIKEEDMDKLFQKFSQVNSEASQRQIGSGLGLWISKTLAEIMGGNIKVHSKQDVGTTFVLIIRADYAAPPKETTRSDSFRHRDSSIPRILLVDDDPYNLETHTQMLKSLGYTNIDTATDGYGLFNLFKAKPEDYYDLILTDVNMPNLNGVEVARKIRQFEKFAGRKSPAKIGFVTGHSNNKEKQVCEGAEIRASFYLSKPLTLATLKGVLHSLSTLGENTLKKHEDKRIDKSSVDINSKRKPVVLCVDDDILNLEMFEDLITALGATTIRASSGKEAITLFTSRVSNHRPLDLVLIDCLMPGVDGWSAAAEMKKLAREIPVIGVTGIDMKRSEAQFKASGMDEVVRKPVQREDLEKILTKYVRIF